MANLSLVTVLLLFVCYANAFSISDPYGVNTVCKGACGAKPLIPSMNALASRVPYRLLDFLKQQVPMIIPQGRSELEVSAAWLLDELFPKVMTGDFKYMPPGPKGSMTPLLNPDNIVSPTSSKMQNYIVARAMDARHTPEWAIHKQITFNGALRNYKKAKAMLMYSRMHPTEQGAMQICHIKATMKIPVMVVFSIPRREIAKARKNLAICGIRVIQAPPRLPLSMTKGVKEAVPLPNVDYIFHGYDLLFGNPNVDPNDGRDPGVSRMPIFKTTFDKGLTTSDLRYLIPDGMNFLKAVSCRIDFSSSEDRSEKAYIDSLSNTVGAESGFLGFSFKASTTVQHKTEEMKTASHTYVNTQAVCSIYTGAIFMDLPPKPSDEFIASLKKWENNPSEENIRNLVDNYGTHFITDVVMGAKFGEESQVTTESYEKMVSDGLDVGTAAGYSGSFSAGVTTETSSEKEQREKFESSRSSKTTFSYGSNIPANGDATTWASTSSDDPMPINMELKALSELLTEEFLGDSGIDYEKLKQPLIDYLTQYCSKLVDEDKAKDCMPPTEFATNGPGLKALIQTDTQVVGAEMIDETTMALAHGFKDWKLVILKDGTEAASRDLMTGHFGIDMVVCRGKRRLGVLLTDYSEFCRIEMYEISEDGKTITKKEDIDLLNSGMTYDDMQGLNFNTLSYYADVNGFLMGIQGSKVQLWKLEGICTEGRFGRAERFLSMENWDYIIMASAHLSDNIFAVALQGPHSKNEIKMVEVKSEFDYDDHLTTLQFSGTLYCTDLYKDQDTLYALGAEWYEDRGRLAAIRWIKDEKRTEFAADLLTAEFMKDTGSDIGVLSVYGNNAYYGETGSTDKGRVMEYQFKYE